MALESVIIKMGVSQQLLEKVVNDIWREFDIDGSGQLEEEEFNQFIELISLKTKINKDSLKELLDRNKDSRLTKEECLIYLKKNL